MTRYPTTQLIVASDEAYKLSMRASSIPKPTPKMLADRDVIIDIANGTPRKVLEKKLQVSRTTLDARLGRIRERWGVASDAQLVYKALILGVLKATDYGEANDGR